MPGSSVLICSNSTWVSARASAAFVLGVLVLLRGYAGDAADAADAGEAGDAADAGDAVDAVRADTGTPHPLSVHTSGKSGHSITIHVCFVQAPHIAVLYEREYGSAARQSPPPLGRGLFTADTSVPADLPRTSGREAGAQNS